MTFKYYQICPNPPSSASTTLIDGFQELLNEQFYVATDVFRISEEYVFGSGSFVDLDARIVGAISGITGEKLGDDFKTLLFKDVTHPVGVGRKYYFDNNYWITINAEYIKNLASSCTVRRANNVLRWMSEGGEYLEEPCSIEYSVKNPRNDIGEKNYVLPGGYSRIYVQQNDKTNQIKDGQRFLFGQVGNWYCFKVYGGGVRNFLNAKTIDNESANLLALEVEISYLNEDTDDLVLGIADKYLVSTSASSVNNIVVTPNSGSIIEGETSTFDVRYYSGSVILSGSFVFSVSGSDVPVGHYTFTTIDENTFSVLNNEKYMDYPLSVLCSGSSGSRIFDIELRGDW